MYTAIYVALIPVIIVMFATIEVQGIPTEGNLQENNININQDPGVYTSLYM